MKPGRAGKARAGHLAGDDEGADAFDRRHAAPSITACVTLQCDTTLPCE
jgi:hypothetical protein